MTKNMKQNIDEIKKNIKQAFKKTNYIKEEPEILAISKLKPIYMIEEAVKNGITSFGETRVQDLIKK